MIGRDVTKAANLLSQGKLVAIPTETVYGLAANALDPNAIAEIYRIKNRPSFNPLILHVPNWEAAKRYVTHFPIEAEKIAQHFWPGSLSILLPKNNIVPDVVTAGSSQVVLRVPNHPLTLELLNRINFPLAAPSANISNTVSPTSADHVKNGIGNQIDYILDGGRCQVGIESTIISIENGRVQILREGGISQEVILKQTGLKISVSTEKTVQTPGQLKKHYATQKPLYIVDSISEYLKENPTQLCSILYYEKQSNSPTKYSYFLSKDYNLSEIANQLFAMMRLADQDSTDCILIEPIKIEGIGRAIDDRLKRAASN
ncbi:MAG: L-threonylcarbamoyladenylate synthase [Bacteroidia bacterium]|jgi:L-threonylcarbamoyladenylate synthase|nr:L-threonylcarbamoyladenylate synthase [Bacteroidia bacterium]